MGSRAGAALLGSRAGGILVTRDSLRRATLVGLFAAALASCGTVLGLGDYLAAPGDASVADDSRGGVDVVQPLEDAASGGDAAADGDTTMGAAVASDGSDDAAAADTGGDAALDAGAGTADGMADAGNYVPPAGWTLVAFAPVPADASTPACPAGYTANSSTVVFGAETAGANACTCGACTSSAPPATCVTGPIAASFDYNGSLTCAASTSTSFLANADAGMCNTRTSGPLSGYDMALTAPPPAGGSCSPGATLADTSQVSFAGTGLVCTANASAGEVSCTADGTCSPAAGGEFLQCLALAAGQADGGSACPPGPFHVPREVGTGALLDCSPCVCTYHVTCTNPIVTFYRDSYCTTTPYSIPANGTCVQAKAPGNYASYVLSATTNPSCTGSSTVVDAGLTQSQTLCCTR